MATIRSRHTVRRVTPATASRTQRLIEPWVFEAKDGTALAKLERAFFDALESVDAIEDHKAKAKQSGTFTDEGVLADALQFAAANLAPKLKRARQS
jgi:hypothetical protein